MPLVPVTNSGKEYNGWPVKYNNEIQELIIFP